MYPTRSLMIWMQAELYPLLVASLIVPLLTPFDLNRSAPN